MKISPAKFWNFIHSRKILKIGQSAKFSKSPRRSYLLVLVWVLEFKKNIFDAFGHFNCNKSFSLTKKYFSLWNCFVFWQKPWTFLRLNICGNCKILKIAHLRKLKLLKTRKMLKFRNVSIPRTLTPVKIYLPESIQFKARKSVGV